MSSDHISAMLPQSSSTSKALVTLLKKGDQKKDALSHYIGTLP
jgi:hypothetical protein